MVMLNQLDIIADVIIILNAAIKKINLLNY